MERRGTPLLIGATFLLTVVASSLGLYNSYVEFLIMLIGINIMLGASLNLINGYMGEFSVGHAAFMGVGAYVASLLTVWLLANDRVFGLPVLPDGASILVFPLALVVGAVAAALFSLLVAVPSFRTRGDYLAIITLAVNFIFKSVIENLDAIGGPRGFMGMGGVLNAMERTWRVPWLMIWVFVSTVLTLYVISRYVRSTMGKGIVAIRDDEIAAEVMAVDTRRLKVVTFMLGCGFAGLAGGLHAHLLGFINPSSYFILQSVMVMVIVYLGGMGSLSGTVISAVGFTLLLEALRPLGVGRWLAVPLILILLMRFRPSGLMGDRELPEVFPWLRRYFPAPEDRFLKETVSGQ